MFNEIKMLDWGKGTSPIWGGRKVDVVAVDGNKRQISWNLPGEPEPVFRWVDLNELSEMQGVKIPPKSDSLFVGDPQAMADGDAQNVASWAAVAAEEAKEAKVVAKWAAMQQAEPSPDIATKEIDLATQRDQLAAQIADLQNKLAAQTEDYDGKLKAQLEISNGLAREVVLANQRVEAEKERRQQAQAEKLAQTAKLTSAALRISDLRDMLHLQQQTPDQSEYDYLEHLIMETGAELKGEIDLLKGQGPKRAKIESRTDRNIGDVQIAKLRNEGWEVVFETVIPMTSSGDYGPVCEDFHIIRFERTAQEPAYTPQPEARAAVDVPVQEETPEEPAAPEDTHVIVGSSWGDDDEADIEEFDLDEDDEIVYPVAEPVLMIDEPAWKSETDPVKRDRMIYEARKQTVGQKAAGRMIAQERGRAKRQGEQDAQTHPLFNTPQPMVRVGNLLLDPKKFPITCTIQQHGLDATIDALNDQIRTKVQIAMETRKNGRDFPPMLLGVQA